MYQKNRWRAPSAITSMVFLFLTVSPLGPAEVFAEKKKSRLSDIQILAKKKQRYLSPHLLYKMAEKYSVKPTNLRLRALFSEEDAKKYREHRQEQGKIRAKNKNKQLFHLVKSKGGEEVISQDKLDKKLRKHLSRKTPQLRQVAEKKIEGASTTIKEATTLESLPRCRKSTTERMETPGISKEFRKRHSHDVLIVPPKYDTQSASDLFGEAVELIVYDPKQPKSLALVAKGLQASCLPYRLRSTGQYLYQHYGDDALRNYDGDPDGDGESLL